MAVGIVLILACLDVGYTYHLICIGFISVMITLISKHSLLQLMSTITLINQHIPMQKSDNNYTSWTNWFHVAGTDCRLSGPEFLNVINSIGVYEMICSHTWMWQDNSVDERLVKVKFSLEI